MRLHFLYILFIIVLMEACSPARGNRTGHEFMPDMVHSTAVEANVSNYYYYNTWGEEEAYKKTIFPKKPVNGTIPRGMASVFYAEDLVDRVAIVSSFSGAEHGTEMAIPANGGAPYYYGDNDAERQRAIDEIIENPFPITANGLERGKELYDIYCGICHGPKGDGNGHLVREPNAATGDLVGGLYPAAPANLLQQQFVDTTNGVYYHSIMYGKNVMGSYADKLSFEERWQVIHYIRALQAKDQKLQYDENDNTIGVSGTPYASIAHLFESEEHESESHQDDEDSATGEHESDSHNGGGDHDH